MPAFRDSRNLKKTAKVDTSPPADADNDMGNRDEAMPKPSLRDAYEAYDEYIVCEYEVEEHMEKYESDAISKSRGFMTTLCSDGRGPMRTSSVKNIFKEVPNFKPSAESRGSRNTRDSPSSKAVESERTKSRNALSATIIINHLRHH